MIIVMIIFSVCFEFVCYSKRYFKIILFVSHHLCGLGICRLPFTLFQIAFLNYRFRKRWLTCFTFSIQVFFVSFLFLSIFLSLSLSLPSERFWWFLKTASCQRIGRTSRFGNIEQRDADPYDGGEVGGRIEARRSGAPSSRHPRRVRSPSPALRSRSRGVSDTFGKISEPSRRGGGLAGKATRSLLVRIAENIWWPF